MEVFDKKAYNKAWYRANKERHRATTKAWSLRNREFHLACIQAWKDANPEKARAHTRRHSWKLQGICRVQADAVYDRWLAESGKCEICDKAHTGPKRFDIDHVHDPVDNRVRGVLCRGCNRKLGRMERGQIPYSPEAVVYSLRAYA